MQPSSELGDLGGLAARLPVVRLDPRGTGDSAQPEDRLSFRCDRQVDDLEALRLRLGLDRIDLLGHSAGGTLALLYALRYPARTGRLVLVAPSPRPIGLEVSDEDRRQVAERRAGETWYPEAHAAFERIWAGAAGPADWDAITPFTYGRWDDAARAHAAEGDRTRNDEAAGLYYADGAFEPDEVVAGVAAHGGPVLVIAGDCDVALPPGRAADYAALFGHGRLAVLPGAGHTPWLDVPDQFVLTVLAFLAGDG